MDILDGQKPSDFNHLAKNGHRYINIYKLPMTPFLINKTNEQKGVCCVFVISHFVKHYASFQWDTPYRRCESSMCPMWQVLTGFRCTNCCCHLVSSQYMSTIPISWYTHCNYSQHKPFFLALYLAANDLFMCLIRTQALLYSNLYLGADQHFIFLLYLNRNIYF